MPRLVYRRAVLREIAEIAAFIERESNSRAVADAFIEKLTTYCERIASLPGLIGHSRPELGGEYRSTTFGNYVIFFRYANEDGPRSHVYIIHIVQGARDIEAYFRQHTDEN